ncbi:TIGR03545 family protein [Galenea microaerophila]
MSQSTNPTNQRKIGWIRWSGVGILLGVSVAVFALGYFQAQKWVKQQIEQQASQAWGAKVEIGKVNLTLAPLGIELQQIALTDPDKPMENLLVLDRLKGDLSFYHWVAGRTVINHALAQGLALHQPRKVSGALPKSKTAVSQAASKQAAQSHTTSKPEALKHLNVALPKPEELLKKEPLLTEQRAQQVQQDLDTLQKSWQQLQQTLPNEQTLKSYQQQFQDLTQNMPQDLVGIQQRQMQFETLKKRVEQDKQRLQQGKQQLQQQLAKLKQDIALLKQAPAEDFRRLQAKYSLDNQGLANLTALLFGPKVQSWLQTAQDAYQKAQPVIAYFKANEAKKAEAEKQRQRSLGHPVRFTEYDPEPSFIVHKALVSAALDQAKWMLELKDLNFEHALYGKPTTFKSFYQPEQQPTPLVAAGMVNHVMPQQPLDKVSAEWKQYHVRNWVLLKEDHMTIALPKAEASFNGGGRLLLDEKTGQLNQVQAKFFIDYRQVQFDLSASKAKEVKQYLAPSFAQVNQFQVKGAVKGDLWAPKIEISSDLDRRLSKAFNLALQKQVQVAKAQLKAQLQQRAQAQLEPVNAQLKTYLGAELQLDQEMSALQKILQSKFEQRLEQEKQKLMNRAKRKVEKAVDKEKKKLEDQLQQNLKGMFKF